VPTRFAARKLPKPSKSAADTRRILLKLFGQHPNADTELNYTTPYELLVATILSAQCTDERVNQVTPALFKRYPNAHALARATTDELEPQIQSTGFFRAKSRSLSGMANAVVEQHGGEIPGTMDALVKLPGVGRKTANVVLGHALGVPGLPVDRHVLRVANRIGIARSDDPEIVEQQLGAAMPPEEWTQTSDTLILHGRRICKPRPLCDRCAVRDECNFFRSTMGALPRKSSPGRPASKTAGPVKSVRTARMASSPKKRSESRSLPMPHRSRGAARTGAGGGARESGSVHKPHRSRGATRTGVGGGAPESGSLHKPHRGREAARTGVGRGAPTQTKK
jgi:endonuclease III